MACQAPNGTESNFVWVPCSNESTIYHNIMIVDKNYKRIYPINAMKPFIILTNITNTGGQIDNVESTIKLYKWGGWLGCRWHRIPTLGILDNLVKCNKTVRCPIQRGQQRLPLIFDLSEIRFLIEMLPNNVPYMIHLEIFDQNKKLRTCMDILSIIKTRNNPK
ncbi:unnamed protein product [Onchocerca ochengi]|uniref:ML domain-containing protein n=1 Tax=Onchocerca ochengi TaxID=42157 RepID=A0A182ELZ4_ONCOC|nr:unnamed protein product [Onchocerca ochengi]